MAALSVAINSNRTTSSTIYTSPIWTPPTAFYTTQTPPKYPRPLYWIKTRAQPLLRTTRHRLRIHRTSRAHSIKNKNRAHKLLPTRRVSSRPFRVSSSRIHRPQTDPRRLKKPRASQWRQWVESKRPLRSRTSLWTTICQISRISSRPWNCSTIKRSSSSPIRVKHSSSHSNFRSMSIYRI